MDVSLTQQVFLSLSFSLPPPLSKNKYKNLKQRNSFMGYILHTIEFTHLHSHATINTTKF